MVEGLFWGVFTTKDPILFAGGGTNLYVYVGNDPINFIDVYGLCDKKGAGWNIGGKIFGFGNTILGLAYGGIGVAFGGGSPTIGNNAIQFKGSPIHQTIGGMTGSGAITLGNVIVYASPSPSPGTQTHEMQHTFQSEALGPLYLPAHIITGTASTIISSSWWASNPLEWGPNSASPRPW